MPFLFYSKTNAIFLFFVANAWQSCKSFIFSNVVIIDFAVPNLPQNHSHSQNNQFLFCKKIPRAFNSIVIVSHWRLSLWEKNLKILPIKKWSWIEHTQCNAFIFFFRYYIDGEAHTHIKRSPQTQLFLYNQYHVEVLWQLKKKITILLQ